MISLETAKQLKKAGLAWTPAPYDFFAIPFNDLDEQMFVLSEMSVTVEARGKEQAITFSGIEDWATDYLIIGEAVWIPREDQLRRLLETKLVEHGEQQPVIALFTTSDGYRCDIQWQGQKRTFEAFGASEAYAMALLKIIGQPS